MCSASTEIFDSLRTKHRTNDCKKASWCKERGCPVVIKAHSGHLHLSNRVFGLIQQVLKAQGLPAGLIGMIQGGGSDVGVRLVQHPAIAAGAFTGSTRGGAALQAVANARPRPIPFYGELGSVNPVVALPGILASRGAELAATLAGSISLGCGQFCTSPGVIVLLKDAASDAFVTQLQSALAAQKPHAMLTPAMRIAFDAGVAHMIKAGVIDPTKVTRTALSNAASVATLLLTSDALIAEKPKAAKKAAGGGHGGASAEDPLYLAMLKDALLTVAGCGAWRDKPPQLMNLRSSTAGPDEFSIVPPKALEMPEDLAALPEPTPGGENHTDPRPKDEAVLALGGTPRVASASAMTGGTIRK